MCWAIQTYCWLDESTDKDRSYFLDILMRIFLASEYHRNDCLAQGEKDRRLSKALFNTSSTSKMARRRISSKNTASLLNLWNEKRGSGLFEYCIKPRCLTYACLFLRFSWKHDRKWKIITTCQRWGGYLILSITGNTHSYSSHCSDLTWVR